MGSKRSQLPVLCLFHCCFSRFPFPFPFRACVATPAVPVPASASTVSIVNVLMSGALSLSNIVFASSCV